MRSFVPMAAALLSLTGAVSAHAEEIVRHPGAAGSPILAGVTVPANATYLYLSGQVPSPANNTGAPTDPATYGDTKTQATSVFRKIDALLKAQGYTLGDVIKLTVFLVGDPGLGGKQDFQGFQQAYSEFFGTAGQPNLVARSTVQVAALANPGFLVEIEATAARTR
ncbi:enamine deaminase RidA (YjgF/YER057c/UK114 family) [Novosphingobium sp. PhB165]|uniref:RidA family protein n=1 Tax=Novosphingobium sp. PhB165 TaxID=2485105 RepID=UPI0010495069|nr:RidA family protein [Novosphingobium sp. PhB165]TCM14196.1 enamine deaminase RidA (YjgF/YER057c/UK114 family) [Novosphingobium sp. PhB165]